MPVKKINDDIKVVEYIIRFLLGNCYAREIAEMIGYTSDETLYESYKLIIKPSHFFYEEVYGSQNSLPSLPLLNIENVPLLFGIPKMEMQNKTLIIEADIIASAYFLLSRYEEFVRKDIRDIHGRFPGKESLPYMAGFLARPIVDEYGNLLKKWLRQLGVEFPTEKQQIQKIYLTHDIDEPSHYRTVRNFIKGLLLDKQKQKVIKTYFGKFEDNPVFTFPWIVEQNKKAIENQSFIPCEQIFFFKSGGNTIYDKPVYNLYSKDIQSLFDFCFKNEITIGLHASYAAGMEIAKIGKEKIHLENAIGKKIFYNRHHFLACREPKDYQALEELGITDDFTMGYADISGFRLGTSRPVPWINPVNKNVSLSLTLHPLTIMECTLDRPDYMGLNFEEAYNYCIRLIEETRIHCGDLVLLWHNTTVAEQSDNWQRKLYEILLNKLAE